MSVSKEEYKKMTQKASPPSKKFRDCLMAFLIGGLICAIGEVLQKLYLMTPLTLQESRSAVSVTLIFIAAGLTAVGIFDKIAKVAGAGTLVPITGFSNAIVSPAIEFKPEGQIMGIGAKMFTIAGPVLVFGITASAIYGIILYIINHI